MGARHQVYLIAKVIPHGSTDGKPLYRSLGGFDEQWGFGRWPVQAIRRFIDLANQPQNAAIIQFELDAIQRKYNMEYKAEPFFPQIPCPYLLYVLAMAWSFHVEVEGPIHLSGHSIKPNLIESNRGSWSRQNDEGITIIDVSDLSNPAYCHVIHDSGIISAEQYIRIFHTEPSDNMNEFDKVDISQLIRSVEDIRLLTRDVLFQVWPFEYPRSQLTPAQAVTLINKSIGCLLSKLLGVSIDIPCNTTLNKEDLEPILVILGHKPFTDRLFLSLTKVAARALPHADSVDSGADSELPGQVNEVSAVLGPRGLTIPESPPFPRSPDPNAEALDISGRTLIGVELTAFLSHFTKLKSVNLSNTHATIDTVKNVLMGNPTISHLNLLGTPICDEEILGLLASEPKLFYYMDNLLHPVFLSFHQRAPYDAAFWFPAPRSTVLGGVHAVLPFFTPQRIVQAFTDYLIPFKAGDIVSWKQSMGLFASACMSYGPRPEGSKWGERFISIIPGDDPHFALQGTYVLAITLGHPRNSYAFLRMFRDSESGSPILDPGFCMGVKDFINVLVEEGRPAPTKFSVDNLIKLIKRTHFKRMDAEEFRWFGPSSSSLQSESE